MTDMQSLTLLEMRFKRILDLTSFWLQRIHSKDCKYIHRQGSLPEDATIELLLGQLNPFNHCFSTNEILLIPDVKLSPKWGQSHFIKTLGIQSFLAFPVQVDGKPESVFLAAGYSINLDYYT